MFEALVPLFFEIDLTNFCCCCFWPKRFFTPQIGQGEDTRLLGLGQWYTGNICDQCLGFESGPEPIKTISHVKLRCDNMESSDWLENI